MTNNRGNAVVALTLCFAGFAASSSIAATPAPADDMVIYTVRKNDTLIGLASKYLRSVDSYKIVQRRNGIANPRAMPVGKRLSIPMDLLKYRASAAKLEAFRGQVAIVVAGRNQVPVVNMPISEGNRIGTAANSFVTVALEDGSRLSMPSNSAMKFNRLRRILLTGSIDYELEVETGGLRSKVVPKANPADRYRVRTPVSVSAVRGTDYRTRIGDPALGVFTETVEGEVGVSLPGHNQPIEVGAGTGAAVRASGEVTTGQLLPPPELINGGAMQSDDMLRFAVQPAPEAQGYRAVVAADAGFVDIAGEAQSDSNNLVLQGLPNGRYFVKTTVFSDQGFEGMPSTTAFKRVLSTVKGEAERGDFGFRFKWTGSGAGPVSYRFQLSRGSETAVPMVDELGLTTDNIILSTLPNGTYFWRVGATRFAEGETVNTWTDFEKLTVSE